MKDSEYLFGKGEVKGFSRANIFSYKRESVGDRNIRGEGAYGSDLQCAQSMSIHPSLTFGSGDATCSATVRL